MGVRLLHKRQRQKNASTDIALWNTLSSSDLIGVKELEVELDFYNEVIVFNSAEDTPQQDGFFHGEGDGMTINLLSTEEEIGVYGSLIDTNSNNIYHFYPGSDGVNIAQKSVSDFEESDDHVSIQEKGFGFYDNGEASNDHGDILDIMVVWTTNAECANSDLSEGCTLTHVTKSNMIGKIRLAIAETNAAFSMSGINTKLRLVYSYRDSSYYESTSDRLWHALQDITYRYDGWLDDVHVKRAKYGADLVSFWINADRCGLSWMGPSKDYMFSVVSQKCATGYFSFGHEIAHNIGCNHDRGSDKECGNSGLNYGYRDKQSAFRDIMSYDCVPGECDNNYGKTCSRVQRFSNTYYTYEGLKIGDKNNNCAHHINSKLPPIASFFASKTDDELKKIKESDGEESHDNGNDKDNDNENDSSCKERGHTCDSNTLCCSGYCGWARKCL